VRGRDRNDGATGRSNGALTLFALACAHACAAAADPPASAASAPPVQSVVVTATRIATPPFDAAGAVDRIDVATVGADRPGVSLSEVLAGVPGLQARDRQNYAQDLQLSVRGFGTRASFGLRGVRLVVDGIPATMPDGQGQLSHVDLGSAESIEVLRGPFSALYGNSSGGVIQVTTRTGRGAPQLRASYGAGSDGQRRAQGSVSGSEGPLDYLLSASHFQTDGWRDHSAARRDVQNAKLGWDLGEDTRVVLVGNAVDQPQALDPLGLSRAEMTADPRGVDASALTYRTRKSLRQSQGGLTIEHRLDASDQLRGVVYAGERSTVQYQAIPVAAQANAASPGGVIVLARGYGGGGLRWTHTGTLLAAPATLVAGVDADRLLEHRQGLLDYTGTAAAPVTGEAGALRRDQGNRVSDVDPYLQLQWRPGAWTLETGVRRSRVRFSSHDRLATSGTPDTGITYGAVLPVLSALYAFSPGVHVYASAGRGFETPTLNELGYRADGQPGLATTLRPSRSNNAEVGLKLRDAWVGELSLAAFAINTRDELSTLTSSGGRSTYQNAASTHRRGLELEWAKPLVGDWSMQASATWLDAHYDQAFLTCTATPCTTASVPVAAGNRLPGVARASATATLGWQPAMGWHAALDARAVGRVYVNDVNSDSAAPCTTLGASAGWRRRVERWTLDGFARLDNLADRRCVGSVIVNDSNSRFFEPAPGRTWFAGVAAGYRF
jgi:iron complex outermembrane receptor protein